MQNPGAEPGFFVEGNVCLAFAYPLKLKQPRSSRMIYIMKNVVSFILAISFLTTATFADGVTTLAGSEWGEGQDSRVVIQFAANGKVSGNLGCNRFFGTYKRTGAKLSFSRVASTKMACPEPMMATEARISTALSATAQADATHLKLVLRDAEGKELLILRRRDFD